MHFSTILGMILSAAVLLGSILLSSKDSFIFVNEHAALVVIGGTFSATLIAFPFNTVFGMFKVFFSRIFGGRSSRYQDIIEEVIDLAKGYRQNEAHLSQSVGKITNPFLQEAIQLIVAGGIEVDKLNLILKKRAATHFSHYRDQADTFKTISKLPPAFGLLGAVLGMISLMQGLGSEDAFKTIGPAMAIAMVATFYGIAFANFILIPIGENIHKSSHEDMVARKMVIDGVKLLQLKEHPLVIQEEMKSYLLPKQREKLKGVI